MGVLEKIAQETGKTVSQVSLRWVMQKPGITAPVIVTRSVAQLDDNMGVIGWALSSEQMKSLDDASAVEVPYPYGELHKRKQ